eukprot:TRINITY_DN1888_c0_g1_i2.p1 TRINITY_DN1888_c0_g1~~TRINITY_DN1888_c0_g1_i2.p1  ORF type:complete len:178 (-),score=30.75 TRINITY_DN1888_c0_g1_i2:12-545(-)
MALRWSSGFAMLRTNTAATVKFTFPLHTASAFGSCGSRHVVSGGVLLPTRSYAASGGQTDSKHVVDITSSEDFAKRVMEESNARVVVVDCHAQWCPPCRTLGPRLEAAINKRDGKLLMAKVDVDAVPKVGEQLMVSSIPAVFAFNKRELIDKFVGSKGEADLEKWIDSVLAKSTASV